MKHTIFALCILLSVTAAAAQTTTADSVAHYFFYPNENVYFNTQNNNYIYYDSTGNKWENALVLPKKINLGKQSKRAPVNYNGNDVWADNPAHLKKYRTPQ